MVARRVDVDTDQVARAAAADRGEDLTETQKHLAAAIASTVVLKELIDAKIVRELRGPDLASWATWIACLKAMFALPLMTPELEDFKVVSGGRTPPAERASEFWVPCGRRTGPN